MGPRIGSERLQAVTHATLKLHLEGAVVGCEPVVYEQERPNIWIRSAKDIFLFPQKPSAICSYIGDSQGLRFPDGLLNAGIPLPSKWQLQMRGKSKDKQARSHRGI